MRSCDNKKILGVCGGIAKYFEVDPTLIRVLWTIGSLSSFGVGILAYIIVAFIMPVENKNDIF